MKINNLVDKVLDFGEKINNIKLRPYQRKRASQITKAIVLHEPGIWTTLWARKSGKSEMLKVTMLALMTLLPELAKTYLAKEFPRLKLFKDGINIAFAGPKETIAKIPFIRLRRQARQKKFVDILSSLDLQVIASNSVQFELSNNSTATAFSGSETAANEGPGSEVLLLDEASLLSPFSLYKILHPMVAHCVTGNALISTSEGYIPISELIRLNPPPKVLSYSQKGLPEFISPSLGFVFFKQEILKITLIGLKSVKCTLDHYFLTRSRSDRKPKYRRASELTLDNMLAVSMGIPKIEQNVSTEETDFARLVGYMLGDGSFIETPSLANADVSIQNDVFRMAKRFGCEIHLHNSKRKTKDGRIFLNMSFVRKDKSGKYNPLNLKFRELVLFGQKGRNKIIPEKFFSSGIEVIRNILIGLYATDGYVMRYNREGKWIYRIGFTNISFTLCSQVALLLSTFGIHSSIIIKPKENKNWQTCYVVVTSSQESVVNFMKEIPVNRFHEKFPALEVELQGRKSKLHGGATIYDKSSHKREYKPGNKNLIWIKIKSIESVEKETVYDLTIPKNHNYCSNGIISHNCDGLISETGTPGRKKCPFLTAIDYNKRKFPHLHQEVPYTGVIPYSKDYASYIDAEIDRLPGGMSNPFFRMNYLLEWLIAEGHFVDFALFAKLGGGTRGPNGGKLVAGVDWGKVTSATTITILEGRQDLAVVVDLFGIKGDWDHQFEYIIPFLKEYPGIQAIFSESTGSGDPLTTRLAGEFGDEIVHHKFMSAPYKDKIFTNLHTEITANPSRFQYFDDESQEAQDFIRQFLDAEQEVKGKLLIVHKPDEEGSEDDYLFSTALANDALQSTAGSSIEYQTTGKKREILAGLQDY